MSSLSEQIDPTPPAAIRSVPWLTRCAILLGASAALVGAGYLAAWLSGYMTRQGAGAVTMKTNTALTLLLLGLGLVMIPSQAGSARRWAGRSLAALAALIGLLSLSENLFGWNLGIDQLLAREPAGALGVAGPNLMGTPAALSFILSGLALLLFSRRDGRGTLAAQILALAVCLIALLGTLGYLYGAQILHTIVRLTGVSCPTALSLLMLGLGLLLARPTQGLMQQVTADDLGGANLRRWLPVLLLPVILGWLRIFGERCGWFDAATGTAVMMIIFIVSLAVLAYTAARPVSRSAAALQSQRQWLQVTLASIGDAVLATDTVGLITFINPVAESLTGWKRPDALGRSVQEVFRIINEQTGQPADDIVSRVLQEGAVVALANHTALQTRDGRTIPIEDSAAPIKDATGRITGVVLVFHDVTQKRRAQEALRESEQRYRSFVEASSQVVWTTNAQGEVDLDIPAWQAYTGQSAEEAKGFGWMTAIHPDDRDRVAAAWVQASGARGIYEVEYRLRVSDGSWRDILARGVPVLTATGEVQQYVGTCIDITERKRAEEAMRESEERLAFALETINTGAWNLDLIDGTTFRSLRHDRIFGYESLLPQWTFEMFLEHVLPEDREEVNRRFRHAVQTKTDWAFECRIRRADGEVRWIWAAGRHQPNAAGEIRRMAGVVQDITDRKRVEEALRERERLFQDVIDGSPSPIFLKDRDGKFITINAALEKKLGRSREEIKGKTDYDLAPKEQADYWRTNDQKVMATGQAIQIEEAADLPDGHHIFLANKFPLVDARGQTYGLGAISHDITDRKRTEEALQQSEDRFRTMADLMPQLAWIAKADGFIYWYNRRWYEYTGTTPQQMEGWGWQSVHDPDLLPTVLEQWKASIATGRLFEMEFPLRGADGIYRSFLTRGVPLKDAQGRVIQWLGTNTDISERKQAEETQRKLAEAALRLSEEEFRSLAESMPQIVWATRPDGWNIYFNQQWVDYTGLTMEESYGHGWITPFHPDDKQRAWEAWQRATKYNEPYSVECRLRRADGAYRWWLVRGSPMLGANGEILKWFGTCTDIEDLKRAEAAQKEANDTLEQRVAERTAELTRSNKELEQFAYISSHDLQEPLRQVQAFVNLLRDRYQDKFDGKAAECLQFVYDGAVRMSDLVRGLLDYSRVGARDAQHQALPSQQALDAALANLQAAIAESQARITHDELPAVSGVPIQLAQLFQNLIANAIKFRRDGVAPEIHVGACRDGNRWIFTVKDNGIGIAPKHQERIFLIFQRLHTRDKYPGTGIGLAVCKKIVEQHGGRLWVESQVGQGSTFYFSLPLS